MSRAEVVLASVIACCVTIILTTLGVHCQMAGRDTHRACLEAGGDPLACRELSR